MAKKVEIPEAPLAPGAIAKVLAKAIGTHATVDATSKYVRAHRPAGFGGDFSAVRLARV